MIFHEGTGKYLETRVCDRVLTNVEVGELNLFLLEIHAQLLHYLVNQVCLLQIDLLQGAIRHQAGPEGLVVIPFDMVVFQDQHLKLGVIGERLTQGLYVFRKSGLHLFEGQIANIAEGVHLFYEIVEIGRVLRLALRQVQCVNLLVFHNNELYDLTLYLADEKAS